MNIQIKIQTSCKKKVLNDIEHAMNGNVQVVKVFLLDKGNGGIQKEVAGKINEDSQVKPEIGVSYNVVHLQTFK